MATNAAVVTAAFIGNRGQLQKPGQQIDPRGYAFDLDGPRGSDSCFRAEENRFDPACLIDPARRVYPPDDVLSAAAPENDPGEFETFPLPSRGALVRHLAVDPNSGAVWLAYGASPGIPARVARVRMSP